MSSKTARKPELSLAPVEAELVSSMAWLINLRWLAGLGVLSATWFTDSLLRLPLATTALYLVGFVILGYNAVFRFILQWLSQKEQRDIRQFDVLTKAQIGLDWVAMTALIHFSGGVASPAILYFFFHIIIAAILLSVRATFVYAAIATWLIGVLAALEYFDILTHYNVFGAAGASLHHDPLFVVGVLFFFASTMFVATYLASTLSSHLRKRQAQVIELSQNLQNAYSRLQTVYESAEDVSSTLELDQVLDRLVRRAANALNVRACSIRLFDETGARLYVAATYGLSDAYVKKGDLLIDQNPLVRESLSGKTTIIGDVTTDTRLQYPAEALAEGIRSMLTAPLLGKKGALGLIRAYSAEPKRFTPADAEFLTAIAREGSIAIENAMAYRALGKLDEMKSNFVLTVTHELRSPISVVRSLMRTMLAGYAGTLNDQQREMLNRVQYRADFLQTLIDDLLDLAAGKSDLVKREERVVVCLDEAVERVIKRFEIPAQEKQITLESRIERGVKISATEQGIDRVLNNLISNAVKYTPNGGRVAVTLSVSNNRANIVIADSGIGIPAESLPHLFEEFYRAPNAQAQEKEGTGLGLAITKDLVTRFGGHIAVQSQVGQGTTFTVTFPTMIELSI
jgi:signal transduction histidine kinase